MRELEQAMLDRAVVDKSILLNEVLYFVASVPESSTTSRVREAFISEAARKLAVSSAIPVSLSDVVSKGRKSELLNALFSRARDVHDFDTFLADVSFVNGSYDRYFAEINTNYTSLNRLTSYARWIYLSLYVLGSLITLMGMRQEISD